MAKGDNFITIVIINLRHFKLNHFYCKHTPDLLFDHIMTCDLRGSITIFMLIHTTDSSSIQVGIVAIKYYIDFHTSIDID